ncbi:hypothetical protein [Marinomonas sp. PE14-40]|uniref:baseplate complex protein n=1 Tax=Marinomonas sp. PE14-40 TaxID=3060621 RepID=UPI003F678BAF
MIVLALDKTKITGYGLKVTCELALPDEDLSGQSSSSATAEKGFKPKRLRVSLNIKYEDAAVLSDIVLLSTATHETKGTRKVYNIENQTAKAFSVRQVRFTERVSAQELDDSQAWSVSFVLVEHLSIPEKVEAMAIETNEPTVAPADNKVVSDVAVSNDEPMSWLENTVAYLDSALSNEDTASDEI